MGTRRPNARHVLAQNLQKLMDHLELNQTAIGDKCEIHQTTVGRILKEKNAPDLDTLEDIASAVGVSIWQLMVPGLDPSNLPVLQNASAEERELYDRLKAAAELLTGHKRQ